MRQCDYGVSLRYKLSTGCGMNRGRMKNDIYACVSYESRNSPVFNHFHKIGVVVRGYKGPVQMH
ncbi:hypothetical protein GY45DRAFT_1331499 [Cubamyces sp. BRFM 1775]|nr:hypothetical protein GY45DRAFT_1331499 [Cubamyces sp. BRFM 1775]